MSLPAEGSSLEDALGAGVVIMLVVMDCVA